MISPEAIGRGLDVEYKQSGFSEGRLNFTGSKTDNALDMGTVKNREFYLALGIAPTVDIFYKSPEQSVGLLGLKVQLMGAPSRARSLGNKLSFTFAMGANRDSFKGTYDVKLKSEATEVSVVHGYRFSPWIMVYEGISYSKYQFEGEIQNATSAFDSDEFDYTADGIIGAHAGLELGGHTFKLKLEYAAQKIEWSHTTEETYHSLGAGLVATF